MSTPTSKPHSPKEPKGPLAWMTRHRVAANLLMTFFLVGGGIFAFQVRQEIFPEFELDFIQVIVPYPGASPEEVEKGIVLAIEDEVRGVDGVKKVSSSSKEGSAIVIVELLSGAKTSKALQDVKNVVDKIRSLPAEAERPIVSLINPRRQVISLIIHGNLDLQALRSLAEHVQEQLISQEGITLVEISGTPPIGLSIEVPQKTLQNYKLTLDQIALLIRKTALDMPAGGVRTPQGEVLLRTQERRDLASEFGDIDLLRTSPGTQLKLEDIATIKEGFEETDEEASFNGEPAVRVNVFRVGDQTPIDISNRVHGYVSHLSPSLPPGVSISTWDDAAEVYSDRINLLMRNAIMGLCLVLILLALFLEARLAFWVTLGIPTAIIGSFLFLPLTGASINMISLFAFIVTLGIVVDDAIIVGEHIFQKREKGMPYLQAALEGIQEIASPVIFAVLTNVVAFLPLFFIPGFTGKIFLQIPAVVVTVLLVSLMESLFILPSHISHTQSNAPIWYYINTPNRLFDRFLRHFINHFYIRQLQFALRWRYVTVSIGVALLILAIGSFGGGYMQFSYLPRVDSDIVTSQITLPFGSPLTLSKSVQQKIAKAAQDVAEEFSSANGGKPVVRGIYTQVGSLIPGGGPGRGLRGASTGGHLVGSQVFLISAEARNFSGNDFAKRWREKVGAITGAEVTNFTASIAVGGGKPLDIELSHTDTEVLDRAATDLADLMADFRGVTDIDNGVTKGKPQMSFKLKPQGRSLGITSHDLAMQVRSSFYGTEALRQQRGRNEIKVMVRLPKEERESIHTIEKLLLRSQEGVEIPLSDAAKVEIGKSYTSIERTGGRRVISVNADVDETLTNANEVIEELKVTAIPYLTHTYPGLTYSLEGQLREQQESLNSMKLGFMIALIAIYALLAIPFNSYIQPIIVMVSIPFGIIGAVIGHLLLGYELSIISLFGIIALAGVVVNDSLVYIVTTNQYLHEKGMAPFQALVQAGRDRFRPILLTSLTTFFGLTPMIFERSMQARFLIPMAISLGFGVLFATFISLLIVPAFYLIIEDFSSKPNETLES